MIQLRSVRDALHRTFKVARGLKPARDDKNKIKGLHGAPEGAPLQNASTMPFRQPV